MKSPLNLATVGALCAVLACPSVFAQSASAPVSRADVKAETRAAEKAGKLTPAGEGVNPKPAKLPASTYTRSQRKSETIQARKSGDLVPAGDSSEQSAIDKKDSKQKSTKTRAERKAETIAARKSGQLVPAGEGPVAPRK